MLFETFSEAVPIGTLEDEEEAEENSQLETHELICGSCSKDIYSMRREGREHSKSKRPIGPIETSQMRWGPQKRRVKERKILTKTGKALLMASQSSTLNNCR